MISAASAATVTSISGKVSLNRGSGFHTITTNTGAKPGDLLMAGPSASAEIVYDDGCRQKVEAGTVVTVAPKGACKAALVDESTLLIAAAVAGGAAAGIIALTNDNSTSASAH